MKFEARCEKAWAAGNMEEKMKDALEELFAVATEMDQDPSVDRTKKAQAWWRYGQICWKMDSKSLSKVVLSH